MEQRHNPSKEEIERVRRLQTDTPEPSPKKTFTGKDDVIWKPWCVNHISMALGDALPTARDPLKVCRVISIRTMQKGQRKYQALGVLPTECFVCTKSSRFWMAEH